MKRIAIITLFYNNYNYGGVLQALALQKKIEQCGYQCDVVSYDRMTEPKGFCTEKKENNKKKDGIVKRGIKHIRYKGGMLLTKKPLSRKRELYNQFNRKYIKSTEIIYNSTNVSHLNNIYDIFVVGSDQVWSPLSGRQECFLTFVKQNKRKIAYAASIGADEVSNDYLEYLQKNVCNLDYISVREQSALHILKRLNLKGKDIEVVLDPTMLYDGDWTKYMKPVAGIHEKYILLYFLGENEDEWKNAYQLAKASGMGVINIAYNKMKFTKHDFFCKDTMVDVGPAEFLWLIKNASKVLTDSFHGTVFSILFHKSFYIFLRQAENLNGSMNGRIKDLINELNLSKMHFDSVNIDNDIQENWIEVDELIQKKREKANTYLEKSIKDM